MKYVVIYDMDSANSAFCFDTHNEAVRYINACTKYADNYLKELKSYNNDYHKMFLKNGKEVSIVIKEYPDSKVRFDLSYSKNGRHVETRRFTKRHLAVNFANKILDEKLESYAEENEDEYGEWALDDPARNLKAHLELELVILGNKESSDYDILGVKPTASIDEVKQAFRKLAIKYHPDQGGDSKRFQKIHDAYERIANGTSTKTSQQILESYGSMDMRCFFKNFESLKNEMKEEFNESIKPILNEVRAKAGRLIGIGILMTIIGSALTAGSYNAASPGGKYTVFGGLIIFGIWNILKGLYYLINPKAALEKKK